MIQLKITKITLEGRGVTLELRDVDGLVSGFEVYCPNYLSNDVSEEIRQRFNVLDSWARARTVGDTIALDVPWTHIPEEAPCEK